jgi:hypothetical protein
MLSRPLVLAFCIMTIAAPASAEKLCGWLENPTPANWWLTDRNASWTIMAQGGEEPEGMDLIGDISVHDYVATNGGYGYACACIDAETDVSQSRITRINSFKQLKLSRCQKDKSLKAPGQ